MVVPCYQTMNTETVEAVLDALEANAPVTRGDALTALASADGWGPSLSRDDAQNVLNTLDVNGHITIEDDIISVDIRDEGDIEALTTTTLGDDTEYVPLEDFEALRDEHLTLETKVTALTDTVDELEAELEESPVTSPDGHFGDRQDELVRERIEPGSSIPRKTLVKMYLNYTTKISSPETAEQRVEENAEYAMDMEYDEADGEFTYHPENV